MESASSTEAPRHSAQFYFPDGDIVLSAPLGCAKGEAQRLQLFRVHKFLLSHHSVVFRDMFNLSTQPADASDLIDGHPVVALQDDAKDVEELLHMLYNPA